MLLAKSNYTLRQTLELYQTGTMNRACKSYRNKSKCHLQLCILPFGSRRFANTIEQNRL